MINRFEHFSLAISEINRYWHKITTEELEKYGLKGSHATYLTAMAQHENGITAPQLCEICGKDKADVSRMMNILMKKGLAVKEGGYNGIFLLTDTGREAAEQVSRRAALAVELAGQDLTEETRAIFYDALDSIVNHLRQISENGLPENNK